MIKIDDNFGSKQILKDVIGQSHMVDIRVRLNGEYYWFEGDFLKDILPYVEFNQIDNEGIKATLEGHKQTSN